MGVSSSEFRLRLPFPPFHHSNFILVSDNRHENPPTRGGRSRGSGIGIAVSGRWVGPLPTRLSPDTSFLVRCAEVALLSLGKEGGGGWPLVRA